MKDFWKDENKCTYVNSHAIKASKVFETHAEKKLGPMTKNAISLFPLIFFPNEGTHGKQDT